MALGTMTRQAFAGGQADPVYFDLLSFAGDGAYPTGGTTGIEALVKALVGNTRTILAILPQNCGGYVPVYDEANDKLMVYGTGSGDKAALTEQDNNANLSGTTFKVIVISK